MNLTSARSAAHAASSAQHYPQGALYVVATPIGNLADITLRALHVLQLVDAIACEDTRHTQKLLGVYDIERPLLAVHEHNEAEAAHQVLARLAAGERVAYVSDAGTPAISDPGARLVRAARAAGFAVVPLPGASSVTAALSVAGVVDTTGFVFAGFLPHAATARKQAAQTLVQEPRAVVMLEAPHRIEGLAEALALLGERLVTVGRELTKQFEEIATVSAQQLSHWLRDQPMRTRGEFVLVLHPKEVVTAEQTSAGIGVLKLLLPQLPLKTAVKLAAEISGEPRNKLYAAALAMAEGSESG